VIVIDRSRRQQMARIASDVRLRGLRDALTPQAIAERICQEVSEIFPLEAQRLARGWSRSEVSARLDALYLEDDLASPHITSAELCRWEHAQRRPSDERIEYLCRLYETRPDRLGFGVDYSAVDVGHLARSGISNLWPRTMPDTLDDLVERVRDAREEISVFGLTRNFYARDEILPLFESQAVRIPVTFYVMDPRCDSRRDRYRLEPIDAAMEDPARYTREILRPLYLASKRVEPAAVPTAGMRIFTYNFPCSFAMERVDRSCRVMLYGHGKRGTEGPILVFDEGTPYWDYFTDQLRWLHRLATEPREPWSTKGIIVRTLTEEDLSFSDAAS
jgi:transcriptional regulator with XRE-family HTH domain